MAVKKKTTTKAGTKRTATKKAPSKKTGSRTSSGSTKGKTQHKRTADEINTYKDQMAFETGVTVLIICIVALLFYLSYFGVCGKLGTVITGVTFGFFGWISWFLPVYVVIGYLFAKVNKGDFRVPKRLISSGIFMISLAGLIELLLPSVILTEYYKLNQSIAENYFHCLYISFQDVALKGKANGGIIGRFLGDSLSSVLGRGGAAAVFIAVILLCLYLFYGLEMLTALRKRNAYHQEMEEAYTQIQTEEDYREPSYRMRPSNRKVMRNTSAKSGGQLQSVNLQVAGQQLDKLEEEQKKAREEQQRKASAVASNDKTKNSKKVDSAKKSDVPSGMQEIYGDDTLAIDAASSMEAEKTAKKQAELPEIPIYREEMNQKFGSGQTKETKKTAPMASKESENKDGVQAQKPMDSFAHKAEVTDVRPASQIANEMAANGEKAQSSVRRPKKADFSEEISKSVEKIEEKKAEVKEVPYQFPPLDLLALPKKSAHMTSDEKLRETAARLQETLQSFNVDVQMGAVTCGPTVTRYEVLPAQGVRVNKITNLADDLKLSLAAQSIRIEAPIPGKSAVGIEVPNDESSAVYFRELLQGNDFEKSKSPVSFAVGKDIAGKVIVTDIAKMPHLLIAGATGSGKSVCINTLIMSILYKSDPNDVKLIMIDPKVVELSVYNGIPHLFCPVVTDPKEAAASLNWAVREMMDRYNKFKELGVRNIQGYNDKIKTVDNAAEAGYEKMPLLVIIVDEFADLMMVASKEVEDAVCRLAQLARAAGIHLILATQRPSVNVITGIIKANIPSRIAFSVSSAIDSRTILDKGGAEKLLGKGDMLFFPSGYSEPVRLQGAFVSDKEVSDVVDFLKDTNETPVYNDKVTEIVDVPAETESTQESNKPDRDEYFEEAGRFVIESERAAAGQLQRRFSIGFNRAGRIIDQLHKAGVVGPAVGTKPRQVLMTIEQFENYLGLGGEEGTPVSEEDFLAVAQDFEEDM